MKQNVCLCLYMERARLLWVFFIFLGLSANAAADFTIPEEVLLSDEFSATAPDWGTGTLESRTDWAGNAVAFEFSGLSTSGTGMKDNYLVQDYGQILPSHGNGDFSNFDGYSLWIKNNGVNDVSVSLFMNTGFTGPSGNPSSDLTNNTFWQSAWQDMLPDESFIIRLDFDSARAFEIEDNKFPHTLPGSGSNGDWFAINATDRTEVSSIGFQITGSGAGTILVQPVPEPASLVLAAAGMGTAGWLLKKRQRKECDS